MLTAYFYTNLVGTLTGEKRRSWGYDFDALVATGDGFTAGFTIKAAIKRERPGQGNGVNNRIRNRQGHADRSLGFARDGQGRGVRRAGHGLSPRRPRALEGCAPCLPPARLPGRSDGDYGLPADQPESRGHGLRKKCDRATRGHKIIK